MNKIYIIAALLLTAIGASAQDGRAIYNKWSDSEGVSAVYISPAMFRMIGKLPELNMETESGETIDLSPTISSLEGFYLLDIESSVAAKDVVNDVNSILRKSKNYELMMEVKDDGDHVQIFTVGNDKVIESIIFLCNSPDDVQFICIDGTIKRSELEAIVAASSGQH